MTKTLSPFDAAFIALMYNEGDYVNDPRDNGGETRFGISKKSYPKLDIANLTLAQAKAIYLKDFWLPNHCDKLPWPVAFILFDSAVNHGGKRPRQWLQTCLGLKADGVFGTKTLQAIDELDRGLSQNPLKVARNMLIIRQKFFRSLEDFPAFGNGWLARCLDCAIFAAGGVSSITD